MHKISSLRNPVTFFTTRDHVLSFDLATEMHDDITPMQSMVYRAT